MCTRIRAARGLSPQRLGPNRCKGCLGTSGEFPSRFQGFPRCQGSRQRLQSVEAKLAPVLGLDRSPLVAPVRQRSTRPSGRRGRRRGRSEALQHLHGFGGRCLAVGQREPETWGANDRSGPEAGSAAHSYLLAGRVQARGGWRVRPAPGRFPAPAGLLGVEGTIRPPRRGSGDSLARRHRESCFFEPPIRTRPVESRSSGWGLGDHERDRTIGRRRS